MENDNAPATRRQRSAMHLLLILVMLAPGCSALREQLRHKVIKQVSFDHDCPPQRVKILREYETGLYSAWGYSLDVCGRERRYRRVQEEQFIFVDVTDGGSPAR